MIRMICDVGLLSFDSIPEPHPPELVGYGFHIAYGPSPAELWVHNSGVYKPMLPITSMALNLKARYCVVGQVLEEGRWVPFCNEVKFSASLPCCDRWQRETTERRDNGGAPWTPLILETNSTFTLCSPDGAVIGDIAYCPWCGMPKSA